METFAPPRQLVDHPGFAAERDRALAGLSLPGIDAPIRGIIEGLAGLVCCFTLQSCHGHFVHADQPDAENLVPLPARDFGDVTWRIAYLALCVRDDAAGRRLLSGLADIPTIDPEYVQFGSPSWFWERHPNAFALQVEPERFAHLDRCVIGHEEALRVERVRNLVFNRLGELVRLFRA